ncbi:superoxide dismutase family protein [Endozoicomonas arenosclerae]|uniref:superoxide dismutase family protein n=1 Tax=Endozoicomonas arenosclerae TaxID=1633495 RepID=UPI000783FE21|nr:superoxide dismutase family protein [Endozoicomonas arenosclerae]
MFKKVSGLSGIVVVTAMLSACTSNDSFTVKMNQVSPSGVGAELGTITISAASGGGVEFTPNLHDLVPGEHGFHIHENPSCDPGSKNGVMVAALAAGGHYDPDKTDTHQGPDGNGHLGDLPRLTVDDKGFSKIPVVAKRLKLSDLKGRSLMIHSGGDNYSDNPPMGGGGSRIACGVIK